MKHELCIFCKNVFVKDKNDYLVVFSLTNSRYHQYLLSPSDAYKLQLTRPSFYHNDVSPIWRQATIQTGAGLWSVELQWKCNHNTKTFIEEKHLKISSAELQPFCLGSIVLSH